MSTTKSSTVVFLNIWGHRCAPALNDHIQGLMAETDVFCLTEVTKMGRVYNPKPFIFTGEDEPPAHIDGFEQITSLLGDKFVSKYYSPNSKTWHCLKTRLNYKNIGFGSLMSIKNNLEIRAASLEHICKNSPQRRVLQWVVYDKGDSRYLVAHLHGIWLRHNTKGDDPLRDQQSEEVVKCLRRVALRHQVQKVIFGGDLNLAMDTQALASLMSGTEDHSLRRNLVADYGIASTRTPLYRNHGVAGASQHADYVLTSNAVEVLDFSVGDHLLISDHAPLQVKFI